MLGVACATVPPKTDAVGRCPDWSDEALAARARALVLLCAEDQAACFHLDYQLGRLYQHCADHVSKE